MDGLRLRFDDTVFVPVVRGPWTARLRREQAPGNTNQFYEGASYHIYLLQ